VAVGDDLEFDVVRVLDEFLDVDITVAERFLRLIACVLKARFERCFVEGGAHAFSSTACGGLDHHRVAEFGGHFSGFFLIGDHAITAGCDGNFKFRRGGTCLVFVTHHADDVGGWADEFDLTRVTDVGKLRILGEEAVSGMDGVNVGDFRRADDAIDFEITLGAGAGADADGFIGELHVHGIDVRFGVDGDAFDVEFLTGADDSQGDFAAIGYEDFAKHVLNSEL